MKTHRYCTIPSFFSYGAGVMLMFGMLLFPYCGQAYGNSLPDFADLAEELTVSVVNIATTSTVNNETRGPIPFPFGPDSPFNFGPRDDRSNPAPPRQSRSLGSGFIIDESGLIVTNNHVIKDANEIEVRLHNDEIYPATVIGADEKTDIAVLQITTKKPLKAVKFGDSDKLRVGQWVMAIGNPFGLGSSVSVGIISARNRNINAGPYDDFIQTDAAINRGNSGGPLFDSTGNVIGVNTVIFTPSGGNIGIGFSVSSNLVENVVTQLVKYGGTRRGWLGVRIQPVTDDVAESLGLTKKSGALVAVVSEGSPADVAKIRKGDVILEFEGKEIKEMRFLPRVVAETEIGRVVDVVVWRNRKQLKLKVKVGRLEEEQEAALVSEKKESKTTQTLVSRLGMELGTIDDRARARYAIAPDTAGVLIRQVDPTSDAASKGLRPGDVIIEITQQEVDTPTEVVSLLEKAEKQGVRAVLLLVKSGEDLRFVAVKLERS